MKQIALAGIVILVLSGCRAPMPKFDLLSPYGTSRVPAPGTGTIGTGGTYYTPPANPTTNSPIGTGFRPSPPNSPTKKWSSLGDPPDDKVAGDVQWSPTRTESAPARVVDLDDVDVALSRQQSTSRVIPASQVFEHRGPIRIAQPSSTSVGSGTVLRGAPVNNTTASRSPREFVPSGQVVDITELQDTSSTRTVPAPTGSTSSQGSSTLGWRSRT